MKKILLLCLVFFYMGCASEKYFYKNNTKAKLTPIDNISRSNSNIDYYTNEKGSQVGVSTKILVKFINSSNLDNYLNEFNLTVNKQMSENLYLLEVTDNDLTIDVANSLYEKDDVKYAHPDFIRKLIKR